MAAKKIKPNCRNCWYAKWKLKTNGAINPWQRGECQAPFPPISVWQSVYVIWRNWKKNCPTFEPGDWRDEE